MQTNQGAARQTICQEATSTESAALWDRLRDETFRPVAEAFIRHSSPAGESVLSLEHVRTAHYAAFRVQTTGGVWLVRVGVKSPADDEPVDNTGPLGTSVNVPTGQRREYDLSIHFASSLVSVALPRHYSASAGAGEFGMPLDALWLPYLQDSGEPVTAAQWADVLTWFHEAVPPFELPVFTNRAKTTARLGRWADRAAAAALASEYEERMADLFNVATAWGPVHGDAHAGNILISAGRPVLFDLDTVCWAPLVWDLTHLLTRAGTGRNTGYTAEQLIARFPFTDREVEAAVALRGVASRVARAGQPVLSAPVAKAA